MFDTWETPASVDLDRRITPALQQDIDQALIGVNARKDQNNEVAPKGIAIIFHPVRAIQSALMRRRLDSEAETTTRETIAYSRGRAMSSFYSAENTDGAAY